MILPLAVVSTLLLSAFAPACGTPTDEDEAAAEETTGEDAYTTEGTCDGLPRLKSLKTPPGICVGMVSQGFTFARGIAELPSGDLVLAEMGGWAVDRGAIWLMRRLPNKQFSKTRIAKLIDKPSGVTVGPDGLPYVATPGGVIRFDPYEATVDPVPRTGPFRTTGDYKQPRFKLVAKDFPKGDPYRHPLKKIVFDKNDPWKLYVNIGSASDNGEVGSGSSRRWPNPSPEAEGQNALGVIRAYDLNNPDHVATGFTVHARGLRNSMALAVHPTSGALIQGENSRDSIEKADASYRDTEADFPHEELNVIVPGAHYGWPYCFDNNATSPEFRGHNCSNYTAPALLLPGHASPLGMTYYTGSMLPDAYKNQLIVAYHGYRDNGHRLVMVPVDANGVPGGGEPLDIIRGWDKSADGREPLGTPVDVLAAKDGSLYITEDKNGDVLRLSFNAAEGNGLPMRAVPIVRPGADPAVEARCRDLSRRTDLFSEVQKHVIDNNCVSCHGVGPGYPGNLRLDKCDAVGNWQRLTAARSGGRPAYVKPNDMQSELVLRIQGTGYPQMPAGGVDPEAMHTLEEWIQAGAPKP